VSGEELRHSAEILADFGERVYELSTDGLLFNDFLDLQCRDGEGNDVRAVGQTGQDTSTPLIPRPARVQEFGTSLQGLATLTCL